VVRTYGTSTTSTCTYSIVFSRVLYYTASRTIGGIHRTRLYSDLRYLYRYRYEHARVLAFTYIIRLRVARESYCDISRWSCNTVGLLTNNTRLLDKSCCISYRGTIYYDNISYCRNTRVCRFRFAAGIIIIFFFYLTGC